MGSFIISRCSPIGSTFILYKKLQLKPIGLYNFRAGPKIILRMAYLFDKTFAFLWLAINKVRIASKINILNALPPRGGKYL